LSSKLSLLNNYVIRPRAVIIDAVIADEKYIFHYVVERLKVDACKQAFPIFG